MSQWFIKNSEISNDIAKYNKVSPLMRRLLANRGISTATEADLFLNNNAPQLYDGKLLSGSEKAALIICRAIEKKCPIRVIGDYDIDGVCSTYILVDALKNLNANIDYDIPDRLSDGYGINERLVQKAFDDGIRVILTCDNGISAYDSIKKAIDLGMTVVVTDHHEIPYKENSDGTKEYIIPPTYVVNPHMPKDTYPFKDICGAVVAWKFLYSIYSILKENISFLDKYIEFAAFATIGDVMPLADENRGLVKCGLKRLTNTSNLGLKTLIEKNNLKDDISVHDVGFILGPCINAAGRLGSAKTALSLLFSQDKAEAEEISAELMRENRKRQDLTKIGKEEAEAQIERAPWKNDSVYVIYLPGTHEGVIGIIAGRIKEEYNRPVFVLSDTEDGLLKGSGRSVEEYSMYEELVKVKDLLDKFGGHPMAAGLSLKKENLDLLRATLNMNCSISANNISSKITADAVVPITYFTEDLVKEISALEPFGENNPKPLFAEKDLKLVDILLMGKESTHVRLTVQDKYGERQCVLFGKADELITDLANKTGIYKGEIIRKIKTKQIVPLISILYFPNINEYNGYKTLQGILTEVHC